MIEPRDARNWLRSATTWQLSTAERWLLLLVDLLNEGGTLPVRAEIAATFTDPLARTTKFA